ncbi:MAG: class I SAM-dependent methyltransferase [Spirochaetaceae bacterium]|nr:MAG: class I SAM-dependent methyltransferase [Spirochaetaceae bacterium]
MPAQPIPTTEIVANRRKSRIKFGRPGFPEIAGAIIFCIPITTYYSDFRNNCHRAGDNKSWEQHGQWQADTIAGSQGRWYNLQATCRENLVGATKQVLDSGYWADAWAEHRQASGFYRDEGDTVEFWNKRAPQFRRNTTGEAGAGRVAEVFAWLSARGLELSGLSVLDVGAGPGSFTAPLALAGAQVTAIDASPTMIELLHEEMRSAGFSQASSGGRPAAPAKSGDYTAFTAAWEDLVPSEHDWQAAFDLVFVSMCPALSDIDSLQKALSCSRAYLYINAFAGKRESHALYEIWRLLEGTEPPSTPDDAFFLSNLLHTLGYNFELTIYSSSYEEEMTIEEAGPLLTRSIQRWKPSCSQAELERAVDTYIVAHRQNGTVVNTVENRHGRILVKLS